MIVPDRTFRTTVTTLSLTILLVLSGTLPLLVLLLLALGLILLALPERGAVFRARGIPAGLFRLSRSGDLRRSRPTKKSQEEECYGMKNPSPLGHGTLIL
jgi:hypothetical protein